MVEESGDQPLQCSCAEQAMSSDLWSLVHHGSGDFRLEGCLTLALLEPGTGVSFTTKPPGWAGSHGSVKRLEDGAWVVPLVEERGPPDGRRSGCVIASHHGCPIIGQRDTPSATGVFSCFTEQSYCRGD